MTLSLPPLIDVDALADVLDDPALRLFDATGRLHEIGNPGVWLAGHRLSGRSSPSGRPPPARPSEVVLC